MEEKHGSVPINPLYTGGFFHCYMLDESICRFRGVGSILLHLFLMENQDLMFKAHLAFKLATDHWHEIITNTLPQCASLACT